MSQSKPPSQAGNEKEIFLRALELINVTERHAYLAAECGENTELRARVERMLLACESEKELLEPDRFSTLKNEREALASSLSEEVKIIDALSQPSCRLGEYELIEELGRGTTGIVFRARQESLNREVALKVVVASSLATAAERERFQLEAETAAQLRHPNIVPIFEIGRSANLDYYSMALVGGGTLAQVIEQGPLDRRHAVQLIITIAHAVHAAHQHGVIHRDLKPANILMDDQGQPHITDFGLARWIEQNSTLTLNGQILGTPKYMAPEQTSSSREHATTASDVYSLGAILYELLTGEAPFCGESVYQTLQMVKASEPRSLRSLNASVDQDLDNVVHKCLEKEPNRRYASAASLSEDLLAWLEGRPVSARRAGALERTAKLIRRYPLHVGFLIAATLLLLTLGIGGPLMAWRQSRLLRAAEEANERVNLARQEAVAAQNLAEQSARENRSLAYAYSTRLAAAVAHSDKSSLAAHGMLRAGIPTIGQQNDLRGWEWYYSFADVYLEPLDIRVGSKPVRLTSFSSSGRYFVEACEGRMGCVVRDGFTSAVLRRLDDKDGHHREAFWLDDERRLITLSTSGTVKMWDTLTGDLLLQFDTSKSIKSISVNKEPNALVAVDNSGQAISWEIGPWLEVKKNGRFKLRADLNRIALSPDGQYLAATDDGSEIHLWMMRNIRQPPVRLSGHAREVTQLQWHHDSRWLASCSEDGRVRIWDIPSGSRLVRLDEVDGVGSTIAWDPNGFHLLYGTSVGGELRVFNAPNSAVELIEKYATPITALDWNAVTHSILVGREDGHLDLRRIGLSETSRVLWSRNRTWLSTVAWSPDTSMLSALTAGGELIVVDSTTGERRDVPEAPIRAVDFQVWQPAHSAELTFAIARAADVSVHNIDLGLGRRERQFNFPNRQLLSMAWAKNRKMLALLTEKGEIAVWRPGDARPETIATDAGTYHNQHLSLTPDDTSVVVTGRTNRIEVWVIEDRQPKHIEVPQPVATPVTHAWSTNGAWLATGNEDGTIAIWDWKKRKVVRSISTTSPTAPVLAWHPEGKRLASAGEDAVIYLWDPHTGHSPLSLSGHANTITGLDWSPDGFRLASSSGDGTIRVWDATAGYLINGDRTGYKSSGD